MNIALFAQTIQSITKVDGLNDLTVYTIYKDSLGYIWLGTGNSLERFDGTNIKTYPMKGNIDKHKRVNAIIETSSSKLWIGNGTGLWLLDKTKNTLVKVASDEIKAQVNAFALNPSQKDELCIGTESGLYIHKKDKFEHLNIDPDPFSKWNNIYDMEFDSLGCLWVATDRGLAMIEPDMNRIHHMETGDKAYDKMSYRCLACLGQSVYLGTMGKGIVHYDIEKNKYSSYVDVGCSVISSLSTDNKNALYVSTDGNGVHFISVREEKVIRSFRHEVSMESNYIRSNSVYSLLVDKDGVIWFGFYLAGVDYTLYQSNLFQIYSFKEFTTYGMAVRTIQVDGTRKIIGTRDGLYFVDEGTGIVKSLMSPKMRSRMILCSCAYKGKYYIGTYGGGLYVLNPQTLNIEDFDSGKPNPFMHGNIFSISVDKRDVLWIGTSEGLFAYKDGECKYHFTDRNSKLPDINVFEVFFDSTDKGWVCTENGMCIWDPGSKTLRLDVFPEDFFHSEYIKRVYEDSSHRLYFLPNKGLIFYSDLALKKFGRFQNQTLLEKKTLLSIVEAPKGYLWIGSDDGLYMLDKKGEIIPYRYMDGIPSNIFTACPSVVTENDSTIWLGNSQGLVSYKYLSDKDNSVVRSRRLVISNIVVNGESDVLPDVLTVGHYRLKLTNTESNISIQIGDLTYSNPMSHLYEYKLDDNDWVLLSGQSLINLYNLHHGTHVFKIRYYNKPETEITMDIDISSSLSWIFVASIIFIVLAVFVFYIYMSKMRKREPAKAGINLNEEDIKLEDEKKYKTSRIAVEECQRIVAQLETVIEQQHLYRNPDLKISDLAQALGTNAYTMSYIFNQYLQTSYYDYINDYRIKAFKNLVNDEGSNKYTLGAMAELCGFSSRSSFFRHFKKHTGITPNEYIQRNIKNKEK